MVISDFPTQLKVTSAPPRRLFGRGNLSCFERPLVAVVGTRRPSQYGLRMSYLIARDLARAGVCVVSGLARGIDGAAHEGALAGGRGTEYPENENSDFLRRLAPTIAILGHGLDRIYPYEHRGLADRIVHSGGLLLSEYEEGVPPLPHHFPCRNRIIAGLAQAVVVIEAAEKSGSLITAGFAADEGREVFVVPGRAVEKGFCGSHQLIRDGAQMVTRAEEILITLGLNTRFSAGKVDSASDDGDELRQKFMASGGALSLSEIQSASGWHGQLEKYLSAGRVIESGVQRFLWVDSN